MNGLKTAITCLITAFNEEKNIEECIKSAKKLTEKIILIDTGSIDKTVEIAKRNKVVVFKESFKKIVEYYRKMAIDKVQTDWVFVLDVDERLTKELAEEVRSKIASAHYMAYKVPRKNIFAGKWLKWGGWYPDHQTRLIKKSAFIDWSQKIHSTPKIKGQIGFLENDLIHYFHGDLNSMVKKTIIFEDIESGLLFEAKKPVNTLIFFRKFIGEFARRTFFKLGFKDGSLGIIESIYQAFSKTITYIYLYEKTTKSTSI